MVEVVPFRESKSARVTSLPMELSESVTISSFARV